MAALADKAAQQGLRHYYIGCGLKEDKLTTTIELLHALQAGQKRHLAICCSSRDSLDALVYALLQARSFSVSVIVSDMTEKEREFQLSNFLRQAGLGRAEGGAGAAEPPQPPALPSSSGAGPAPAPPEASTTSSMAPIIDTPCVLAVTDVCLKALPKDMLPLPGLSLLVEYDLPHKKEVYQRRLATFFGSVKDRRGQRANVVDLLVAGELPAFRNLERFALAPIQELPVHVGDMFI